MDLSRFARRRYTEGATPIGKVMAGLIGMARAGALKADQKVLFMHTGGLPALHAYEGVVLGDA